VNYASSESASTSSAPLIEEATPPSAPEVTLGQSMPQLRGLPVLSPLVQPAALPLGHGGAARHSTLAQGLSFTGSAVVEGSLTVAGEVTGQLHLPAPAHGHVTVTETGTVNGDIRARNISVLGLTNGLLDAGGGKVTLHGTASVSGRIRYTHLQVNGADLNAQLERVRPDADEPPAR
jgi:cytoskeletal protein CcmA (bactofilin family)